MYFTNRLVAAAALCCALAAQAQTAVPIKDTYTNDMIK